jgi:sorbitol/mannitol transport system substrate-binding protein
MGETGNAGRDVLERVGDKWSASVLFLLRDRTRRFMDLRRGITGISRRMLTVTLRHLERDGLVSRTVHAVVPPRVDYALTPLGRALVRRIGGLVAWAETHVDDIERARTSYDSRMRGAAGAAPRSGQAAATATLTVATVNNPDMVVMQSLTRDFEAKNPAIRVHYVVLPENDLRQKVTADVATGAGRFDIVTVGTYEVPFWAQNRWLAPLEPFFGRMSPADAAAYNRADLLRPVMTALTVGGEAYALPFYAESSMTYYRKDLFTRAGLVMPLHPTWDQVAGFARRFHDPSRKVYGILLRGLPGWGVQLALLDTVINTFGGRWFDMRWRPQLTSAAFTKAVRFYVDLLRSAGEPGATTSGFTELETLMSRGNAALCVDATVAAGYLANPRTSRVADTIGFAYSPMKVTRKGSHWLWAWALGLEGSSKHKAEAFKFLTWATSPEYIKLVAARRGWMAVPPGTRYSTYASPGYRQAAPFAPIVEDSITTADPTDATVQKVPYTGIQYVGIPEFAGIGTTVSQYIAAAIAGTDTVRGALHKAQRSVEHTMRQAGYLQ